MDRTLNRPADFPWHWNHRRKILAKNAEKSPPIREQSPMSQCCKPRCCAFRAKILPPWSDPVSETLCLENSLMRIGPSLNPKTGREQDGNRTAKLLKPLLSVLGLGPTGSWGWPGRVTKRGAGAELVQTAALPRAPKVRSLGPSRRWAAVVKVSPNGRFFSNMYGQEFTGASSLRYWNDSAWTQPALGSDGKSLSKWQVFFKYVRAAIHSGYLP